MFAGTSTHQQGNAPTPCPGAASLRKQLQSGHPEDHPPGDPNPKEAGNPYLACKAHEHVYQVILAPANSTTLPGVINLCIASCSCILQCMHCGLVEVWGLSCTSLSFLSATMPLCYMHARTTVPPLHVLHVHGCKTFTLNVVHACMAHCMAPTAKC